MHETRKKFFNTPLRFIKFIKLRQDCLLQGQAQLDQRVVFCFCTLRLRGGFGVHIYKNEKHGLKMHFKSFQAVLDNVVFSSIHLPLILIPCQRRGVGGGRVWCVVSWQKWKHEFHIILSHFSKCCYFTPGLYLSPTVNASNTTELVVELATIGRVNISSDISIHHTGLLTYLS